MKILYLHQYFRTPAESGAIRSYYIAKAMVEAGHEVVMITSHNQSGFLRKNVDGIDVFYLPVPYKNEMTYGRRIRAFGVFLIRAAVYALRQQNVSVCYATSTPLTIGIIALIVKIFRSVPFLFEVRDLWPEAPVQMGAIRQPIVKRSLYWLEKLLYGQASQIIVLSPGMEAGVIATGVQTPVAMVPNMSDCKMFFPEEPVPETINAMNLNRKTFTVIYTGALGKANGVESMIKLARACEQAGGEIQFLIAGEGSEKKRLEEMASDLGNMRFLPVGDKAMMQRYFSLADAAYISFASVPVLETTSPNKFFDSLAAGKMIIINIPGWIRQITENAGCGFYLNPADPEGGAKMLKALANNPDRVKEFQRQARHLAEDQFEREKLCKQIVSLTTAINGRS